MADEVTKKPDAPLVVGSPVVVAPPPQKIAEALNKVGDPEAKVTLSMALSRTSYGFGPDPETAKIIADSEIHEENCRLEGYKAALDNRDKQNERDHDFRKRRLNRDFSMSLAVLLVALAGAGTGLYLNYQGKQYNREQRFDRKYRDNPLRAKGQSRSHETSIALTFPTLISNDTDTRRGRRLHGARVSC